MASDSMLPEHAEHHVVKRKRQPERPPLSSSDGEEETFVFEANEAWKDFHSSLLRFYEAGDLCDITLKVLMRTPYFLLCVCVCVSFICRVFYLNL